MTSSPAPIPPAIRVAHPSLCESIRAALTVAGVSAPIADIESEVMAEADLMGTPSHGVRMLPGLIRALRDGRINKSPHVRLTREFAAVCTLEGDHGPGRYISVQAMNHAVERAARFGIGACMAAHASHWGRAHAYAYRAARAGVIGLCTTNAQATLAGFGSARPILGNNPLAIGVPRGQGRDPVVLDIAMTQAAIGKIETYRREGRKVPLDWGLDSAGQPTDDPAAILASRQFLPMGGHKGEGLAMMMEMLTGVLACGALAFELPQIDGSGADAHASKIFVAIRPESFGEAAHFEQRVEDLLNQVRQAGVEAEEHAIHFPGEHGYRARDQNLVEGIPVDAKTVADLAAIGVVLEAVR